VSKAALEGRWDYYEQRIPVGLLSILGEVKSIDGELARMEQVHQETLRAVVEFPLARWEEERVNNQFNIRRKVFVMLFGINEHQIHHRAQVGVYLHMLTGLRASPYPL
jgi:hypothetical protein